MATSLRRRLVLILLGLSLATWFISVGVTFVLAQHLIDRQIDRQLTNYMDMVEHTTATIFGNPRISEYFLELNQEAASQGGMTRVKGFGTRGRDQATNIWLESRRVLVGEEAPAFPEPRREGFITWTSTRTGEPSTWRVLYRRDNAVGTWLAVGLDRAHAANLGGILLLQAAAPLLILLPLTVAVLIWGVRRGLRPLSLLAGKIEARKPTLLDPIASADVPEEIQPVVVALNGLLGRLQRALASEGRFTANAAHELQTPLAAIKAEVQRYQRLASDTDTQDMLERISVRVTRATNTVSQLLTLARLDPEQEFQREPVDLYSVVIAAVAEEGVTAAGRALDVRVPEHSGLQVQGQAAWLTILVRNLVSNAFRYSPEGGPVDISLEQRPGCIRLRIANDCEPIPDELRHRLTDRFYSLPGNSVGGVGLGLSIAARIAELHGARLSLESWRDGRGFLVQLDFPLAGQAISR